MAWAVWCALALYPAVRHLALRVLVVAYPAVTTLVAQKGSGRRAGTAGRRIRAGGATA